MHVFLVLLSTSAGAAGAFNGGNVSHAYAACLAACGGTCPLFGPLACHDWCLVSCRPLADLGTDSLLLLHNAKDGFRWLERDTVPKAAVGITSTLDTIEIGERELFVQTSLGNINISSSKPLWVFGPNSLLALPSANLRPGDRLLWHLHDVAVTAVMHRQMRAAHWVVLRKSDGALFRPRGEEAWDFGESDHMQYLYI